MKIALVTTTINIPRVLELYRAYGPDVEIIVAGDVDEPEGISDFCESIHAGFLSFEEQADLYPTLSRLIGPRCIQRRNFAILEALRMGVDAIITIDDDVLPLNDQFFEDYRRLLSTQPTHGIMAAGVNSWFDPGQLLMPAVRHRGFPLDLESLPPELYPAIDMQIGVAVGLWVGDADVDATHRIANPPAVVAASALAEIGIVLDRATKTVWNAQNVGFIRELAPAMFQAPGIGRADDIFASLITQCIMRGRRLRTHIGKPLAACWQQRSTASKIRDLEEELFLYRHTALFADYLDASNASRRGDVIQQVHAIYKDLGYVAWFPKQASEAGLLWARECEKIL